MRDTVRTVEPTAPQAGHLELLQHGLHLGRVRVEEVQDAVAEVLAGGLRQFVATYKGGSPNRDCAVRCFDAFDIFTS